MKHWTCDYTYTCWHKFHWSARLHRRWKVWIRSVKYKLSRFGYGNFEGW